MKYVLNKFKYHLPKNIDKYFLKHNKKAWIDEEIYIMYLKKNILLVLNFLILLFIAPAFFNIIGANENKFAF